MFLFVSFCRFVYCCLSKELVNTLKIKKSKHRFEHRFEHRTSIWTSNIDLNIDLNIDFVNIFSSSSASADSKKCKLFKRKISFKRILLLKLVFQKYFLFYFAVIFSHFEKNSFQRHRYFLNIDSNRVQVNFVLIKGTWQIKTLFSINHKFKKIIIIIIIIKIIKIN